MNAPPSPPLYFYSPSDSQHNTNIAQVSLASCHSFGFPLCTHLLTHSDSLTL